MASTEYNLDGILMNNQPVEEFFKTEDQKEVESVYKEDISKNSNKNPVRFGKPKFKYKKERNGKVKKITPQEYYNQEPNGNFGKCNCIKDVVISLLLSGLCATSREIYATIQSRSTHNIELKNRIATETFYIDKIYSIMWQLKKSALGADIISTPTKDKKIFGYAFSKNAKAFTLEQSIKLSKQYQKGIPKTVIKKAVKKVKDQRENKIKFNQTQISEIISIVYAQVNYKFKDAIERIAKESQETKALVNKLMIDTPASDLKKSFGIDSNKLEVEVKGGIEVSFRIVGLG